jgi:YD repeat-containing protein
MLGFIFILLAALTPASLAQQQQEIRYSYDRNGRLTRVEYGSGRAINYKYDAAGRLVQRVIEAPEAAPSSAPRDRSRAAAVAKSGQGRN